MMGNDNFEKFTIFAKAYTVNHECTRDDSLLFIIHHQLLIVYFHQHRNLMTANLLATKRNYETYKQ